MKRKTLQVIISPAKKMIVRDDIFLPQSEPYFKEKSWELFSRLKNLSFEEAKKVWGCSDRLAKENYERLQKSNLDTNTSPAILSYEGIQYKYMAPAVFEEEAFSWLKSHLFILSGLYGALRPFDGVIPYRLEMQARFERGEPERLYDFWGDQIAGYVIEDCHILVDLASKEYSKSVRKYVPKEIPVISCIFGELSGGKIKEKGTYAKMARGAMVRFMAESQLENPEEMKNFSELGYLFSEEYSDEETYVFLKKQEK